MDDGTITRPDGRTVGYATGGAPDGVGVLWCHGGPGSRLEPSELTGAAAAAGLLLVGIDRPGYGRSTPQPGRTIASWVPDALAVADHVGIDRFVTVGVSTGGSYAVALAALAPDRVLGAVPCGGMTDMRNEAVRATMSPAHTHDVWDAPDREAAIAAAVASHGVDGSKLRNITTVLPPADLALFRDTERLASMSARLAEGFTFGLEGYADDRIADRDGWTTFDVATITCPVHVLHGARDPIAVPAHAEHTASIVPGAVLRLFDEDGHFSILDRAIPEIVGLLSVR